MAEFGFSAKVGADVSGFQKGMQKAEKTLKKFADGITNLGKKGIVGSLANVGLAVGGVVTAFKTATKVVRDVAKAIGECTDAYKEQAMAERTLQTAIENNPYITGSSLNALKQFASEMQNVTNYGDEQIMQLEIQLISLGRTEKETMKIIKVATDMASTGTMSLETAVTQLNATLNGNIGRLGQQNAELKDLTEEELKSGKAVDILAEKYKGLAEATVDTSKQLKNIKGDFKEAIGQFTMPSSEMWNKFWSGFYTRGIEAINKLSDSIDKVTIGKNIATALEQELRNLADTTQKTLYAGDEIHLLTDDQLKALKNYLEGLKSLSKEQETLLKVTRWEIESRPEMDKIFSEIAEEKAQEQRRLDEQKEKEDEIVKLKEQYLAKIAEQEAKWENIYTVTGKVVDTEEKLKFYQDQLVAIMTESGGQITKNNEYYKKQLNIIKALESELSPEQISTEWENKLFNQTLERLEAEKKATMESEAFSKLSAQQKYFVEKEFNDRLREMNLVKILDEKEQALKSVGEYSNAEEEKARINEYYQNLINDNAKKYSTNIITVNKKMWKEVLKDIASGFSDTMKKISSLVTKVMGTIKNVMSSIKNVVSKAFGAFKTLIDFNPEEALDNLLVFEDKILTFFVETLPKLPEKLKSIFESVGVLLDTLLSSGEFDSVLERIFDAITTNLPALLRKATAFILKVAKSLIKALSKWIKSGGAKELFETALDIIGDLFKFLVDNLPTIIEMVVKLLADIVSGVIARLPEIVVMILKAIPSIIKSLLQGIWELIKSAWKGIIGGLGKVWNWIKEKITGHAIGTNSAQRGLALVGEKGPELVNFGGGEKVYNNTNTTKILQNAGSGGNVFNVTFENTIDTTAFAMMSQLKQYQRNLAFSSVL